MDVGGAGQPSTPPSDLRTLRSWVFIHGDALKPFEMDCAVNQFSYQVSRVFNTQDVVYINKVVVDYISYEVGLDINVFHARV